MRSLSPNNENILPELVEGSLLLWILLPLRLRSGDKWHSATGS